MKLTMVISKGKEFFIGAIKEIPAVLTQWETIEETKQNVLDALELYLKDNDLLLLLFFFKMKVSIRYS